VRPPFLSIHIKNIDLFAINTKKSVLHGFSKSFAKLSNFDVIATLSTISGPVLISRSGYVPPAPDAASVGGVVYIAENPALVAAHQDIVTNAGNIAENAGNIATNAGRINVNSNRIADNAVTIASNSSLIGANAATIDANNSLILANSEELQTVTKGLAGVAAMPDMFLNSDETFAMSGGVGFFGNDVGLGVTVAQRLDQNWSFGASVAVSGDTASGKLQARWAH